tara:strand:+ start:817 stop:1032 length:216 start_codon:yes stop_codon:yes gene_type:complete
MTPKQYQNRLFEELHFALEREQTEDPNEFTIGTLIIANTTMINHLSRCPDGEQLVADAKEAAKQPSPFSPA